MITMKIFRAMMLLGMVAMSTNAVEVQDEAFESKAAVKKDQPLELDVACDCRTFAYNRGAVFPNVVRGDGFIVNGKMFPARTLPAGTATNDPNDRGSIGDWTCRGTETGAADPVAFITQYHLLTDGAGLVSEGPARPNIPEAHFAVVGGLGSLSGSSGDMSATIIGTNITGCPNLRFTIRLEKK